MKRDKPAEPLTPLAEAAAGLHEGYREMRRAGFTRAEALEIVARTIVLGAEAAQSPDDDDDEAGS